MARTVVWAESALASLEEAAEYIARDSVVYSAALVNGAIKAADSLGEFAERGRRVAEYRSASIRELFVGSYRLIYEVSEVHVHVIAFVHQSRDLDALLHQQ